MATFSSGPRDTEDSVKESANPKQVGLSHHQPPQEVERSSLQIDNGPAFLFLYLSLCLSTKLRVSALVSNVFNFDKLFTIFQTKLPISEFLLTSFPSSCGDTAFNAAFFIVS